ncbi:MAG TPA: penicillin-insensitive murein endopeptidase [Polyangiaceae bacterium]
MTATALAWRLPGCVLALTLAGCLGTPTPLAPAVAGSVGMPHSGVQTDPAELPVKGEGFVRFRPKSPNYWGNRRLTQAILDVSAKVATQLPGGAPLVVGDLSARRGGKIPGHRSHRTGRDIDLLFYTTTPSGAAVRSPGFIPFDADGLARLPSDNLTSYVRLDVERQWLFIKELLVHPAVGVQFIFVSRDIEALLIDYAIAKGENLSLVWQAETVLLQPGDSAPHDDHIHVRIACTPEEAVMGCEGGGPLWEWLPATLGGGPLGAEDLERIAADDPLESRPALATSEDSPTEAEPDPRAASVPGDGA